MAFEDWAWPTTTLGSIARFRAGSAFKPEYQGEASGEIPFIKVSDFSLPGNEYQIRAANNWVGREMAKTIKAALHPAGATVFAKIGVALTYNRRRLLVRETAIDNNLMSATPVGERVSSDYLYFLLCGLDFNVIANGSALPYLNVSDLQKLEVGLPDIRIQTEISEVLLALERRIDLLRQTNATLESIAQALFKSWFIDFDPVRAKAEGREPEGMDAATAALFPAEFEESALGLIPKGWRVGAFGELALLSKGAVNPMDLPTRLYEHYSLPAFDAGQLPVLEQGAVIKSNKTRVPRGAVLQSKLNPHIPRVWLVADAGEQAVCSTEFLPWVASNGASPALIYCTLRSPTFEAQVRTLVTGTSNSHQRVKPDQVAALSVVAAPQAVTEAFDSVASSLLTKVAANRLQARSLAEVRDALLPRLISGKLRLPQAQEQVEDALA